MVRQSPWPDHKGDITRLLLGTGRQGPRPGFQNSPVHHPCPPRGCILMGEEKGIYDLGSILLLLWPLHPPSSQNWSFLPLPAFTPKISAWYNLCFWCLWLVLADLLSCWKSHLSPGWSSATWQFHHHPLWPPTQTSANCSARCLAKLCAFLENFASFLENIIQATIKQR